VRQLREKAEIEQLNQKHYQNPPPPKKKFKNEQNIFPRFESGNLSEEVNDCNDSSNGSQEFELDLRKADEFDRYILFEFDKNKESTEPLVFWKNYEHKFPFLAKYASSILLIPATTTNVEREFSTAGWILNERRAHLRPDKLENT
jgi:hypothetical protein